MKTPTWWHCGLYFWEKNKFFSNNLLPFKPLVCLKHCPKPVYVCSNEASCPWTTHCLPVRREGPPSAGPSPFQKHSLLQLFLQTHSSPQTALPKSPVAGGSRSDRSPSDRSCSLPLGHARGCTSSCSDGGRDLLWSPYTCGLEEHTTQPGKVIGKYEAYVTLSLTQFKCSCKTSSLLILGTAEERCWKRSCQSVQRSCRRWREKRKKAEIYRWEGGNRRGEWGGAGGRRKKKRNNNPKWD